MGYTTIVFDSVRRTGGSISAAQFKLPKGLNIKKIWLKSFFCANTFASAQVYDYVTVDMSGPFDSHLVQPDPILVTGGLFPNTDTIFIVPYLVSATNVLFKETTDFQQCIHAEGNGEWANATVVIGHNHMTPTAVAAVLTDWQIVVMVETF